MQPGYYWIKHNNEVFPARWDSEKWHHHGEEHEHEPHEIMEPIVSPLACQTGCTCTRNPDGSITIHCN